jgi:hypothetical protein
MLTSIDTNLQDLLEGTNRRSRNQFEWALETVLREPISLEAGVSEVYSYRFAKSNLMWVSFRFII